MILKAGMALLAVGLSFPLVPSQGRAEAFFLDLSKVADMGLTTSFEGGSGGEDAREKIGFTRLPLGLSRFRGVPFQILDPAQNGGRSFVALKGRRSSSYPEAVSIPVGGKKSAFVYFLQACWWGGTPSDIPVAEYDVIYADGSVEIVPLRVGKELTPFWGADDTENSYLAWWNKYKNISMGIGLYPWKNPHPDRLVQSLTFKSLHKMPLPILFAATVSDEEIKISSDSPKPEQVLKTDTSKWEVFRPSAVSPKGSAIDMSFLLDAPAGKHGRLKTQGDRLDFEDGTPAKFWGVQWPTECWTWEADKRAQIVERLASYGGNLVLVEGPVPSAEEVLSLVSVLKPKGIYLCLTGIGSNADSKNSETPGNQDATSGGKEEDSWRKDPSLISKGFFKMGIALWDPPSSEGIGPPLFRNQPIVLHPEENPLTSLLKERSLNSPFLARWGAGWPNEYLAEVPLLLAAYSAFEGWSGSVGMEMKSGDWGEKITGGLDMANQPTVWGQWPVASLAFMRGDLKEGKVFVNDHRVEASAAFKLLAHRSGFSRDDSEITDPVGELKAKIQESRKTFLSDSGQISWQGNVGIVRLDAPRFQAVIGFLSHKALDNPTWKVETPNSFASISMIALDKKRIPDSNHLLLTGATRTENTGMAFNLSKTKMLSLGQGPVLLEPLQAKIFLHRFQKDGALKIRALDANGQLLKAHVPAKWVGRTLALSWIQGAFYLEVYKKSFE